MMVYLDESGDLGFNFEKPYRFGGSSRYLTLAFAGIPRVFRQFPKDIIRDFYVKYKWQSEQKAASSSSFVKREFCNKTVQMLSNIPKIKIEIITVKKENVMAHIRQDPNKLYNYMSSLVFKSFMDEDEILFIPDERSVKVQSGNSLPEYIQTKAWFEYNSKCRIIHNPGRSHKEYNLQFIDWIAHCVWKKYEDGDSTFYDIFKNNIKNHELYFNGK